MLIPLFVLAALSVAGGYLGIPHVLGAPHSAFHWDVAATSIAVAGDGLVLAWLIYKRQAVSAQQIVQALALPYSFLQRRYWIDELYAWYVATVQQKVIAGLCAWVERYVIIGAAVNGTARLTRGAGQLLRLCQTGRVQTYVLVFLIGVVGCLIVILTR